MVDILDLSVQHLGVNYILFASFFELLTFRVDYNKLVIFTFVHVVQFDLIEILCLHVINRDYDEWNCLVLLPNVLLHCKVLLVEKLLLALKLSHYVFAKLDRKVDVILSGPTLPEIVQQLLNLLYLTLL